MFLGGEGVGSTSDVVSWWRGRGGGSCSSSSTVSGVPSVTELIMLIGKLLPESWFAIPPTEGSAARPSTILCLTAWHPGAGS